jgi:hypothetical protein
MTQYPINMWPGGKINRAATNDELRDERLWQIQWANEVKTASRKRQAKENIEQIDSELVRRGVIEHRG